MLRIGLIAFSFVLAGCQSMQGPQPDDPMFAPVLPDIPAIEPGTPGAIYNVSTANYLFEDKKAVRVGDLITIRLVENMQAQKKADTNIKKDDKNELDSPIIFGSTPTLKNGQFSFETDIDMKRQFRTQADSKQSNSLNGTVTVMVTNVLPNGYLVVRGDKWVTINTGQEFVRVTGIVRPEDIDPDNSVESTRVGNARISYSGTGQLAEANRQGWLSRFFSSSWWPL